MRFAGKNLCNWSNSGDPFCIVVVSLLLVVIHKVGSLPDSSVDELQEKLIRPSDAEGSRDPEAAQRDILTEMEVAGLLTSSEAAPSHVLDLPGNGAQRRFQKPPSDTQSHGHFHEPSRSGREELLDALGRCYVEAIVTDLLKDFERSDGGEQLVSVNEGNRHQRDRLDEVA